MPLPEGLDGARVDAAVSRLFGVSRTVAAGLIESGAVLLEGQPPLKSRRVLAGE
jgi:23S rRNA pseudouridine1911/1915/1917 synthase